MSDKCSTKIHKKARVFAYIDAFNVYYGLRHASADADFSLLKNGGNPDDCLGRSLYWLDLEAIVLSQLKKSENCLSIKYFSAPRRVPKMVPVSNARRDQYIESNTRQSTYLDALQTRPLIDIYLGWYSENQPHTCARCGHQWANLEEKVTDVNIATQMLCDAYEDKFDTALIISADADLVPPIEAVRKLGKSVVVGLFPGRKRAGRLRQVASEVRGIRIRTLRNRNLPHTIERPSLPDLKCPKRWEPPHGWIWNRPAPNPYFKSMSK